MGAMSQIFTPKALQRGVIARPFPDWMASEACGGGESCAAVAGRVPQCALFNNDPKGRDFAVYGLFTQSATAANFAEAFLLNGAPPVSTHVTTPLDAVSGPAVGSTWQSNPAVIVPVPGLFLPAPASGHQWPHDFPVAIVGVGYSLCIAGNLANSDLTVGFWFVPIAL